MIILGERSLTGWTDAARQGCMAAAAAAVQGPVCDYPAASQRGNKACEGLDGLGNPKSARVAAAGEAREEAKHRVPYSLRACHPGFRHDGVGPIDPVDLVKSALMEEAGEYHGVLPVRDADTLSRSGSAPPAAAKSVA